MKNSFIPVLAMVRSNGIFVWDTISLAVEVLLGRLGTMGVNNGCYGKVKGDLCTSMGYNKFSH